METISIALVIERKRCVGRCCYNTFLSANLKITENTERY